MTDRVYPSSKPTTIHPPVNGTTNTATPTFPATKSQLYGASRPAYRPQPKRQRSRSCFCSCCLWSTIIIIAIILLAAIAGGVIYVLYRPHRPSFSLTTLRISQFNITTSKDSISHLNSKLDLTVSARNPNKKLIFFYDPISVTVKSNGIDVGEGSFPSFVHGTKNTTVLKAPVSSSNGGNKDLDSSSANSLKSDLKKKNGLPLEIQLETKVKVKMGSLKTKKVGIRVTCTGIQAVVPKGKSSSSLSPSSDPKCKVNLRIKIWKWTF
ncbi:Late embryogenesis abundant protein [Macleaya cordata]|uniref:Late embryogenesis abundant protein n=1 Tax=Macleaya cordata TaxID=56857 RepID=A0A200QD69_MACCD|nr:Late embryogenesis abundant protein [Macleaya cordata]